MTYFISGHRDLTKDEFRQYYIPVIEEIFSREHYPIFVIGDCEGVDSFAMDYIYYKHSIECVITIYHMSDTPRHTPMGLKVKDFSRLSNKSKVFFVGGFTSDEERDAAMTRVSDYDIAFVKDNRWDSGTAQNIKRRYEIK